MTSDRDAIVDAVTRQVIAHLQGGDPSCDCDGACAARSSEKVRQVVANGASRVSFRGMGAEVPRDLAGYIDHTLLKPDATASDIDRICTEAADYGFASVCVNPTWVRRCSDNLRGTRVKVASVVGFPFGAMVPQIKAAEARQALRDGAREIDMVINIGALKSADHELVSEDIARISEACHEVGGLNKVILETAMLTDAEKVVASRLARRAKADFIKTSTGFGGGGATVFDVLLMREAVGPDMGIKASGGIRTADDVREMVAAGATRIGASAGVSIVTGGAGSGERY